MVLFFFSFLGGQLHFTIRQYEKVFNGTQDSMFLIEVKDTGQFVYVRNNQAHQINT